MSPLGTKQWKASHLTENKSQSLQWRAWLCVIWKHGSAWPWLPLRTPNSQHCMIQDSLVSQTLQINSCLTAFRPGVPRYPHGSLSHPLQVFAKWDSLISIFKHDHLSLVLSTQLNFFPTILFTSLSILLLCLFPFLSFCFPSPKCFMKAKSFVYLFVCLFVFSLGYSKLLEQQPAHSQPSVTNY